MNAAGPTTREPENSSAAPSPVPAAPNEEIIGQHSGKSEHREWWTVGTWLYPHEVVVVKETK